MLHPQRDRKEAGREVEDKGEWGVLDTAWKEESISGRKASSKVGIKLPSEMTAEGVS